MNYYHIIPVNDLCEHKSSKDCPCKPVFKDSVWVHNSWDKREYFEEGNDKFRKGSNE